MPMKPKPIIVLDALLSGQSIKFKEDEQSYIIQDDIFGVTMDYFASQEAYENNKRDGTRMIGIDINMSHFITLCNNISDEEIFLILANTAMRKMGKEKADKRQQYMEGLKDANKLEDKI